MNTRILAVAALFLTTALAGCFGGDDEPAPPAPPEPPVTLTKAVIALAEAKPLDYTFPAQKALPATKLWFNGTIGSDAAAGYESPGDRGGSSYNTQFVMFDVSDSIPVGQTALVNIQLTWQNRPGEAADLDIVVDLPGTRTHESREYFDEWSWTLPVETKSVATVGVKGATHAIGVQAANARILPTGGLKYTLAATILYAQNVLPPAVPHAIVVPANASGLVFESVKFSGDTHVDAELIVIGPDDTLVSYNAFNDLAVPTESLYVAVPGPGEYVVYATHSHNGFLRVTADAPPDVREARALVTSWEKMPLIRDAAAPGVAEHEIEAQRTPYTEGTRVAFNLDTTFPLEVRPYIDGANVITGDVDLRVASAKGDVARYHRAARYDDDRGRIGFTDETHERENWFIPEKLARGAYSLSAVVDGSTGEIGVRVLTFTR